MTQVLAFLDSDAVYLASDRRLTLPNGELFDDSKNKCVLYDSDGATMAFGFTGLAHLDGEDFHSWLAKRLAAVDRTDISKLDEVARAAEEALSATRVSMQYQKLGILGVGWAQTPLGIVAMEVTVSNLNAVSGDRNMSIESAVVSPDRNPTTRLTCIGQPLSDATRRTLVGYLRHHRMNGYAPDAIPKGLVWAIRQTANETVTVGRGIVTAVIKRPDPADPFPRRRQVLEAHGGPMSFAYWPDGSGTSTVHGPSTAIPGAYTFGWNAEYSQDSPSDHKVGMAIGFKDRPKPQLGGLQPLSDGTGIVHFPIAMPKRGSELFALEVSTPESPGPICALAVFTDEELFDTYVETQFPGAFKKFIHNYNDLVAHLRSRDNVEHRFSGLLINPKRGGLGTTIWLPRVAMLDESAALAIKVHMPRGADDRELGGMDTHADGSPILRFPVATVTKSGTFQHIHWDAADETESARGLTVFTEDTACDRYIETQVTEASRFLLHSHDDIMAHLRWSEKTDKPLTSVILNPDAETLHGTWLTQRMKPPVDQAG